MERGRPGIVGIFLHRLSTVSANSFQLPIIVTPVPHITLSGTVPEPISPHVAEFSDQQAEVPEFSALTVEIPA